MTTEQTAHEAAPTPFEGAPTSQGHDDVSTPPTPPTTRPRWTLTEAAERSDASRSTLRRRLAAGAFPQATKDPERGWLLGVDDLLAAGIKLHRPVVEGAPTPPTGAPTSQGQAADGPAHEHDQQVADLQLRLLTLEADLRVERVQRQAAEQLAAERERTLDDVRLALRALTAAPERAHAAAPRDVRPDAPSSAPTAAAEQPAEAAPRVVDVRDEVVEQGSSRRSRRGWLARLRG